MIHRILPCGHRIKCEREDVRWWCPTCKRSWSQGLLFAVSDDVSGRGSGWRGKQRKPSQTDREISESLCPFPHGHPDRQPWIDHRLKRIYGDEGP